METAQDKNKLEEVTLRTHATAIEIVIVKLHNSALVNEFIKCMVVKLAKPCVVFVEKMRSHSAPFSWKCAGLELCRRRARCWLISFSNNFAFVNKFRKLTKSAWNSCAKTSLAFRFNRDSVVKLNYRRQPLTFANKKLIVFFKSLLLKKNCCFASFYLLYWKFKKKLLKARFFIYFLKIIEYYLILLIEILKI